MKSVYNTVRSPWFKDCTPFIKHGNQILEARLELMQGFLTPLPYFFVRNASTSIDVEPTSWQLRIEGDAVMNPLSLTYQDILALPTRTVCACLECAGNHRALFGLANGQLAEGDQWKTGGISNGEWVGVPLREVLHLAGIRDTAVDILCIGLDKESPEGGFRRALPVAKALHPDTLLAHTLNGEILPKDHGFPLRLLVPGWVGSSSIKWLSHIIASSTRIWTEMNTTSYVLIGEDYPPEGQALGQVTTIQTIKSALALPWPAELTPGQQAIYGYAHSPHAHIDRVEWSDDGGKSWHLARLLEPQIQYSWVRFMFLWSAAPSDYTILIRATDAAGNTQPDSIPFNEKGYLFNQPVPHPVIVR